MEKLLISACLTGENCKYDGGNTALPPEPLAALRGRYELVPVCPENAGGLPTPREPSERRGGGVWSRSGRDVTAEYEKGARIALELARQNACRAALLKERSPSCGHERIYDGTFSGVLVPGSGTAAEKLLAAGIPVYGESEVNKLI